MSNLTTDAQQLARLLDITEEAFAIVNSRPNLIDVIDDGNAVADYTDLPADEQALFELTVFYQGLQEAVKEDDDGARFMDILNSRSLGVVE